jgi:hypothetical protein
MRSPCCLYLCVPLPQQLLIASSMTTDFNEMMNRFINVPTPNSTGSFPNNALNICNICHESTQANQRTDRHAFPNYFITASLLNVAFEVLTAVVTMSSVFWDITPCSTLKVNRYLEGTCRLPPAFTLISCLDFSLILKMEATCSSETSADFQRTTQIYIPEDRTLCNKFH